MIFGDFPKPADGWRQPRLRPSSDTFVDVRNDVQIDASRMKRAIK